MKKIIITCLLVCTAIVAQAASADWAVSRNSSSTIKGYTIYTVAGGDVSTVASSLQDQLKTYTSYMNLMDSYKIGAVQTAASNGAAGAAGFNVGDGTTLALFAFADAGLGEGTSFLYTDAQDVSAYLYSGTDPSPGTLSLAYTDFKNSGTIYSGSSVPEPTSGLLLLLGVAGLALKRKQA